MCSKISLVFKTLFSGRKKSSRIEYQIRLMADTANLTSEGYGTDHRVPKWNRSLAPMPRRCLLVHENFTQPATWQVDSRPQGQLRRSSYFSPRRLPKKWSLRFVLSPPACRSRPMKLHGCSGKGKATPPRKRSTRRCCRSLHEVERPKRVLEIGPGFGRSVVFFNKKGFCRDSEISLYDANGTSTRYKQKYYEHPPQWPDTSSFCGNLSLLQTHAGLQRSEVLQDLRCRSNCRLLHCPDPMT